MSFLDGFTMISLASVGPAPRAMRILADYGMEVIKIAPPSADASKQITPVFHAYSGDRDTKKARIDLKSSEGREAFYKLVKQADVVVESYRPGVVKRLGIGYEDLCKHKPDIIYCSTSGYGQHGKYAQWAGHDINYLALSGYLGCSGVDADGVPAMPGATIADSAGGGMHAAIAIISALVKRLKTNKGAYLDVSVCDGMLNMMALFADQFLATGEQTGPGSHLLTGRYAWYSIYATADGKALSVGAIEAKFYQNLCRLLGLEHYLEYQYDDSRQQQMREEMKALFRSETRDVWTERLAAHDCCVTPVLSIADVADDEHLRSRGSFGRADHPDQGVFDQLAPMLAGCEKNAGPVSLAPTDHTDTEALLARAGIDPATIENLQKGGFVE